MALTDNIVAYYKLDNNANDSVGSRNLTISGATYNASGKINGCYNFDGSNDYIYKTAADIGISTAWSISIWAKSGSFGASQNLFGFQPASGGNNKISVEGANSTTLRCLVFDDDSGSYKDYRYSNSIVNNNEWYHLVLTFASNTLKMYFNGSEITPTKTQDNTIQTASNNRAITIGAETASGGNYFNGSLDEFAWWSRVLSSSEVSELYNSGAGLQYPFTVATTFLPQMILT